MAVSPDLANVVIAPSVIVMVGLPARGKTYISKKLTRYLNWIGIYARVFNVGEYRRRVVTNMKSTADFFRPDNKEAIEIRENCAMEALKDMCQWLEGGGEVGVYDATNSNRARRRTICDYVSKNYGFRLFFIESICLDRTIVEANILEVKLSSPDYQGKDKEEAIEDFKRRMLNYEEQYEALDDELDEQLSYIKIFDQGERFLVNRLQGHICSRIVYFLMNIHVQPRTIYITRHGESYSNIEDRVSGQSDLTPRGIQYAQALSEWMADQKIDNLHVWTSILKQTIQTTQYIDAPQEHLKALNEIDSGICEGLTYEEFRKLYPEEYEARCQDKFHYRYPSGESYQDLVTRLESLILELERQTNLLMVCSESVARCLLAYLLDKSADELPYINVPLHTIYKLTPVAYGCKMEVITLPVDAVDTYRPRSTGAILLTSQERKARRRVTSECNQPDCCGSKSTPNSTPNISPTNSEPEFGSETNLSSTQALAFTAYELEANRRASIHNIGLSKNAFGQQFISECCCKELCLLNETHITSSCVNNEHCEDESGRSLELKKSLEYIGGEDKVTFSVECDHTCNATKPCKLIPNIKITPAVDGMVRNGLARGAIT